LATTKPLLAVFYFFRPSHARSEPADNDRRRHQLLAARSAEIVEAGEASKLQHDPQRGDQFTCRGLPKVVVNLPMDRPFYCRLAGASSGLYKPHQSPSRQLSCAPLEPSGAPIRETVADNTRRGSKAPRSLLRFGLGRTHAPSRIWVYRSNRRPHRPKNRLNDKGPSTKPMRRPPHGSADDFLSGNFCMVGKPSTLWS
jgi:hypothetical protein